MPNPSREAEVCIVGAGAAGGVMAAELAQRGIEVVVVESGPRHDLARRSEYARRFLRGENPWRTQVAALDRYTTQGNLRYPLESARARGVGGSTLHWEGYALRLHADDFRLRTLHGVAEDWPLSYDELEPYYGRAERGLGVAGTSDDPWASPRSTPFPMPPFPFSYSDGLFARAGQAVGVVPHHLPQARNSIPYGGRSQCLACATCHVCPTGAKASVDLTHLPGAEASGRVTVVTDATALRLELDGSGLVRHVVYAGHDRQQHRLAARIVVLAAGAVENPRLLLLSASARFPRGLANSSGLVGKHFMSHPSIDVTGRLREPVYPYRIGFSTAMSRQFAVDRDRARRGVFLIEFLNSAGPRPSQIAVSSGEWGQTLRQHVRERFGHTLGIRLYCEQLPDPENAISLDPGTTDYFGNPVPRIAYGLGAYERETLREAQEIATRILRALGAADIRARGLTLAAHQIGTHRMGKDPGSSVVDAHLRTHDVPNLYLVGSGCFVTASASPPTLTICALAIRAAEDITSVLRGSRPGAGVTVPHATRATP